MKMNNMGLWVLVFTNVVISACTQKSKIHETVLYSIEYPGNWKITEEKGVVTFTPRGSFGKIVLNSYASINFPPPLTKNFIVDMHNLPVTQDQIFAKEVGDHFEFDFEYSANNNFIISKGMRKDTDLFLLHSHCKSEHWPKAKDEFKALLNSFQFK